MSRRRIFLLFLPIFSASCSPPALEPSAAPGMRDPSAPDVVRKLSTPPASLSAARVKELTNQSLEYAQNGDIPKAVALLGQVLRADPNNRDALFLTARVLRSQALELERPRNTPLILGSAAAMRQLHAAHKDINDEEKQFLAVSLYDEACSLAIAGQSNKALDSLAEAFDMGLTQVDMLETDNELDSLRTMPRFQVVMKRAIQQARVHAREQAKDQLASNKPFPFQFELNDVDGKPVSLAAMRGKITVVDFWGTWCPPCRKEVSHFIELHKKYHDKGVEIVGLNYEEGTQEEVRKTIKTFLEGFKVPYRCLIGDDQTQQQVPNWFGYPTTLFLDRAGTVRLKLDGYQSWIDLEAVVTLLLAEDTPKTAANR